jgi:hypothetical protein
MIWIDVHAYVMQGEHGVRPYNICVGANPVFALARTSNGLKQNHQSRGQQ